MYRVQILQELGQYEKALSLLDGDGTNGHIVDLTYALEYRARLLSKLERHDEAEAQWRQLIEINPDNTDYYKGFMENRGLIMGAKTSFRI
jgi:tetratricopeptide (TPR) repeat protein